MLYGYTVENERGKREKGFMNASNKAQLEVKLLKLGHKSVINIKELKNSDTKWNKYRKCPEDQLLLIYRSMYTLLKAGVPFVQALDNTVEQVTFVRLQIDLEAFRHSVEAGGRIDLGLAVVRDIPRQHKLIINTIFQTGEFEKAFKVLADEVQKQNKLTKKIKEAVRTPKSQAWFLLILTSSLMTFVVPQMKENFANLGGQLPMVTLSLFGVYDFITEWKALLGGGLFALWGLYKSAMTKSDNRVLRDRLLLSMPVLGTLWERHYMFTWCTLLSQMLRAGIPIVQAIEYCHNCVPNEYLQDQMKGMAKVIESGHSLSRAIRYAGCFPNRIMAVINAGEASGSMDSVLSMAGEMYREELDFQLDELPEQIKPIAVTIMMLVVGWFALAFYTPILEQILLQMRG